MQVFLKELFSVNYQVLVCYRFFKPKMNFLLLLSNLPCMPDITKEPGNSVGIATDYGLDRPRSNPGGDEIFCQSRPTLGPTQPPVKWVRGLSRG